MSRAEKLTDDVLGRVLSRYAHDRDARKVRNFKLTKPELREAVRAIAAGYGAIEIRIADDEMAALERVLDEVLAEIEPKAEAAVDEGEAR